MRAERSQLTLNPVLCSVVSFAYDAAYGNGLHVALTLFFSASRSISLTLSEWSGWTRWGALNSSFWGPLPWAESQHKLHWPSLTKLSRHHKKLQPYQCLYSSLGAYRVVTGFGESVCLADVGLINLTTALVRLKNKTKLHVCTYAYLCEYVITLAKVVVSPLASGKLCARCSHQE